MVKIISLFQRNYDGDRLVRDELVPGAEWVAAGEGWATRKLDGTCCLIKDGELYKRYDSKNGKTPPDGFIPAQDPDPNTGHWPGWLKVGDGPDDKWHRDGLANSTIPEEPNLKLPDGTYELIGPRINGNPENVPTHRLWAHGLSSLILHDAPRDFCGLLDYFAGDGNWMEGIVWHHPDGRMVKIKAKDFGLKRRPNA